MQDELPEAVRKGLEEARRQAMKTRDRLCVHDGDRVYRIRRLWDTGFALEAEGTERLRGRVEIYDGSRHLYQCLVISSDVVGEERVFEFKWTHPVANQPAVDFVREDNAPIALLGN